MKCTVFVILCLAVVVSYAEPPTYRTNRFRSRSSRQETSSGTDVEPSTPDTEPIARSAAPYPPSGWRPAGQKFELPSSRAEVSPTPAAEYLPAAVYGPPTTPAPEEETTTPVEEATTAATEETTPTEETTTPPPVTEGSGKESDASLVESFPTENLNEQGAYYVLLPDARLQKILYSVTSDPEKQQFSSRLQSVGTQALSGPLILYTPQYVQIL